MHLAVLSSPSILTSLALYVCDRNTTFPPVDARFPIIAAKAELLLRSDTFPPYPFTLILSILIEPDSPVYWCDFV